MLNYVPFSRIPALVFLKVKEGVPLEKLFLYFWKRKNIIIINFVVVFIVGVVYSFFMVGVEYCAKITFLPPIEGASARSISSLGIPISSISGATLLNEQIEILFNSKAIKRRILDKFNFYKMFGCTNKDGSVNKVLFEQAAAFLDKYVVFESESKGSMGLDQIISYTITCYHPSPDTAKQICDFVFSLLDSSVKSISMDRAHRNRVFVEEQLSKHKLRLDSIQAVFEDFQFSNKAFYIPEQIKLTLKNYAEIKSAAILNELKIRALKSEFHGTVPELEELEKNNEMYNQQLTQIESDATPAVVPSLKLSARLLPEYSNLVRETEVENTVILMLSKQVEDARLQEAKNISSLVVVDPPYLPGYKARPKRTMILAMIIIVEHLFLFLLFCYRFYYSVVLMNNENFRFLLQAMKSKNR